MKHLRFIFFSLIAFLVNASIFVSCSVDNEIIDNQSTNENVDTYLKSYYSDDYQLGKKSTPLPHTLNGKSTVQVGNYTITEVFVGNESKARGYLFTNSETNEVESFVDVDRTNFKLTSVDLATLQAEVQNNINQRPEYSLTHEFDIIKVIEDPIDPGNGDIGVVAQGWRYEYGACGNGFRGVYRAYYLFGIRLTKWSPVLEDDGTPVTEPC